MKKYLETERIYLRQFSKADEDNLLKLDADPEVMKYLTAGVPSSTKDIQKMMYRVSEELKRSARKYGVWAAIEKETDQFIGWFHLFPPREQPENTKKLYLGYRLMKKFWGRGIATEVSAALIQKAFLEFGAKEICAQAMKANSRSQRVMLKLGMTLVSDYKEKSFPEGHQDSVLYSLVKI